jgi:hypothetical protein
MSTHSRATMLRGAAGLAGRTVSTGRALSALRICNPAAVVSVSLTLVVLRCKLGAELNRRCVFRSSLQHLNGTSMRQERGLQQFLG